MKRHLPNLFTLLNLAFGCAAIVVVLEGPWKWAVYLVLAASVMDFADGFTARLLKASTETGKQLDSLADLVTFGVVPALFVFQMMRIRITGSDGGPLPAFPDSIPMFFPVLIPLLSAVRLARFNLAEAQDAGFTGLPTPANALFWTGLYWQTMSTGALFGSSPHPWFLVAILLILAFYLIVPVPLMSLKFKDYTPARNLFRYLLILLSAIVLLLTGISGFSLVIILYILLSLLNLLFRVRVEP